MMAMAMDHMGVITTPMIVSIMQNIILNTVAVGHHPVAVNVRLATIPIVGRIQIISLGMNYVYLTWVYFLVYLGAGYPTWYYPYIIATLLDFVPTECGGTGKKYFRCSRNIIVN